MTLLQTKQKERNYITNNDHKQHENGIHGSEKTAEHMKQEEVTEISHTQKAILNYEGIKDHIHLRILGKQERGLYESANMTRIFLDFTIAYYVLMKDRTYDYMIPITEEILSIWDVNGCDIQKQAIHNSGELYEPEFMTLRWVMENKRNKLFELTEVPEDVMYILSNPSRINGSTCVLYPGVLEHIASLVAGSYYLLPSSIHEVIIVPASCSPKKPELDQMIREINETQLEAEDVLTDHAYYYDHTKNILRYSN